MCLCLFKSEFKSTNLPDFSFDDIFAYVLCEIARQTDNVQYIETSFRHGIWQWDRRFDIHPVATVFPSTVNGGRRGGEAAGDNEQWIDKKDWFFQRGATQLNRKERESLKLHDEGQISTSHAQDAQTAAEMIWLLPGLHRSFIGGRAPVITDATACAGGNYLGFLFSKIPHDDEVRNIFSKAIAIENNNDCFQNFLTHNVQTVINIMEHKYEKQNGCDSELIYGSYTDHMQFLEQDVVFLDPPWRTEGNPKRDISQQEVAFSDPAWRGRGNQARGRGNQTRGRGNQARGRGTILEPPLMNLSLTMDIGLYWELVQGSPEYDSQANELEQNIFFSQTIPNRRFFTTTELDQKLPKTQITPKSYIRVGEQIYSPNLRMDIFEIITYLFKEKETGTRYIVFKAPLNFDMQSLEKKLEHYKVDVCIKGVLQCGVKYGKLTKSIGIDPIVQRLCISWQKKYFLYYIETPLSISRRHSSNE